MSSASVYSSGIVAVTTLEYLGLVPDPGEELLIQFIHHSDDVELFYYNGSTYLSTTITELGAGTLIFDPPLRCTYAKYYAVKNTAAGSNNMAGVGMKIVDLATYTGTFIAQLTGDVLTQAGDSGVVTASIATGAVTFSHLADIPAYSILGNTTASVATVSAITASDMRSFLSINNVDNTADAVKTVSAAGDLTTTLSVGKGGTGQTSIQAAIDALCVTHSSGQFLRGDGTHVGMSAIQQADVPTLSVSQIQLPAVTMIGNSTVSVATASAMTASNIRSFLTIDNVDNTADAVKTVSAAGNLTTTLSVAKGGTGQTSIQAAINALCVTHSAGQYLRGDGSNVVMSAIQSGDAAHSGLTGLTTGDGHTQYAYLAGRSGGQTYIGGTGVTDILKLQGTSGNGTATSPAIQMQVGNNGGTVALTVLNNGNIGIDTISPTNTLSLGNSVSRKFWVENAATDVVGRALTIAAGGTVAGTSVSDVAGGNLILQSGLGTGTGASTIVFQTGTTLATGTTLQTMSTKMSIFGNGYVGIGTSSAIPVARLQVHESTASTDGYMAISHATAGTSAAPIWSGVQFRGYNNTELGRIDVADPTATWYRSVLRFQLTKDSTTLNEVMRIVGTGNVGIGTTNPSNILSLGGTASRTIWMERHTTADTAGNSLTVQAGGATSAATNKAGGQLILAPGLSTGTGESGVTIQGSPAGGSGTGDNAVSDMVKVLGNKIGVFGVTPVVRTAAYTLTNVSADRAYDANATTTEELADVLGTLIADLQSYGWLQ